MTLAQNFRDIEVAGDFNLVPIINIVPYYPDSGGGQSSFLIKEPYERVRSNGIDRQIICETNNSIYVIPKEKFYNGNSLLTKYLIDN